MPRIAESSAFSTSAHDAITRSLSVKSITVPNSDEDYEQIEKLYEVDWTVEEISGSGYKQVALQFPDELLQVSVPIFQALRRGLPSEVGIYVLADTSYGSCCVDEVAAQHVDADVIVHYGYSCLSRPSRLPVLYVFSKAHIDVENASRELLSLSCREPQALVQGESHFILIPDVAYAHVSNELYISLRDSSLLPPGSQVLYNPVPKHDIPSGMSGKTLISDGTSDVTANPAQNLPHHLPSTHRRYSLPPSIPLSACTILYVGSESLGLTNLLMTHPENKIISYDPAAPSPAAKIESLRTNKLLMRRYAVVQRARDADVIGILVGTLGVASYLPLLTYLRKLLREHQKKSYTLSVGKLNPAKLANFSEIECFVMVACPENSVVDAKEFFRPIVTPFELCLALNPEPTWPGNYILDFERVLEHQNLPGSNDDDGREKHSASDSDVDRPMFSLISGKYRHAKQYGDVSVSTPSTTDENTTSVVLRNTNNAVSRIISSAGAEFLHQRSFQGLEQRLGEDAPSVLERGRSGVAKGYQDDHPPGEQSDHES